MDGLGILIISVVAYIIHLAILSWVIRNSVMADKNKQHDEIMINLLMAIARKNGATEDEINFAVGKKSKK